MKLNMWLSEYCKPILHDEKAIMVIIWLERIGASNEVSLSKELGIENIDLNQVLLNLYQDRLIEYNKNSVSVSERGKILIEKIGIESDIIHNILTSVETSQKKESEIYVWYNQFRKSYFEDYLKTNCTIHFFDTIAQTSYADNPEDCMVGKKAILIKAYRNWFEHKDNNDNDYLIGRRGSGKSFFAAALSKSLKKSEKWVDFYEKIINQPEKVNNLTPKSLEDWCIILCFLYEKVPFSNYNYTLSKVYEKYQDSLEKGIDFQLLDLSIQVKYLQKQNDDGRQSDSMTG